MYVLLIYLCLEFTKESPSGHFQCGFPAVFVVGGSHDEVPSLRFQK
jgi:hypothetical protein